MAIFYEYNKFWGINKEGNIEMKRIAVGCIYDSEGIVEKYKIHLINSLKRIADEIIIICNGSICKKDYRKLNMLVDKIYIRDNDGTDIGALKDYFCNKFNDESWKIYDEIITFNDSCYGPFEDWEIIFDKMNTVECDYWGIVKKYYFDTKIARIPPYFVVYKRTHLMQSFEDFWISLDLGKKSYKEALYDYEIGMELFFKQRGFVSSSWLESLNGRVLTQEETYSERSIWDGEYKNPLLKYKMFNPIIINDFEGLLSQIGEMNNYDVDMIRIHIERLERLEALYPFSREKLHKFIELHDKVYIFGNGFYGKAIARYCNNNGIKIEGMIVTNPQKSEEIEISSLVLGENDGIIEGVGKNYRDEVEKTLLSRFNINQLLLTVRC